MDPQTVRVSRCRRRLDVTTRRLRRRHLPHGLPAHRRGRRGPAGLPRGAGQFAPGSTFKLASTSSAVMSRGGPACRGSYSCPGSLRSATGRSATSRAAASPAPSTCGSRCQVGRHDLLRLRAGRLYADEGGSTAAKGDGALQRMRGRTASAGRRASTCRPASRPRAGSWTAASRRAAGREQGAVLRRRPGGYPDVTDAARRSFLTRLRRENCADGWRYRVRRPRRPRHRPG